MTDDVVTEAKSISILNKNFAQYLHEGNQQIYNEKVNSH